MRNKFLRTFPLSVLVLTAFLISCGSDAPSDTEKETDNAASTETEAVSAAEEDVAREALGLPTDLSFAGEEFLFLGKAGDFGYYATTDLWTAEETGEPLNDAVFVRNRAVEELLNVTIGINNMEDPASEITRTVQAGDDIYDAVWAPARQLYTLSAQGYLLDFHEIPYLSLSSPWWDQNIQREMSFYGKNYILIGDISILENDNCGFVYFNKKLINDFDLPSPYDLVHSDTWTFDAFCEMIRSVSQDVNGDGKMTDGDLYGITSGHSYINPMFLCMGGTYLEHDENNSYTFTITNERNISMMTDVIELFSDKTYGTNIEEWQNTGAFDNVYTYARSLFTQDKFLFHISSPVVITEFRNMESDFGIVPMPKYDETSTRYYSVVDMYYAPLLSVTVNAPNLEKTGAVMEAMAWESRYTVAPIYKETLLARKYTRDNESAAMLDLIADSLCYDLMYTTNWASLCDIALSKFNSGKNVAVSDYEKKIKAAQKSLEKDLALFAELGEN